MKKFLTIVFFLIFLVLIGAIFFLSTKGLETKKFNNFVSDNIENNFPELKLDIKKIKIKLDIKNINLFLSTPEPEIDYEKINIPVSEIKIYLNFFSLLKAKPKITSLDVDTAILNIDEIQKLSVKLKPSNFKSFLLNKISNGKLTSSVLVEFNEKFEISNYKFKGRVEKVNISPIKNISIKNSTFNILADKDLIMINSISANFQGLPIKNGNINISRKNEVIVDGSLNIKTKKALNINKILFNLFKKDFLKNNFTFSGEFLSTFNLSFDKTFKIKDFKYNAKGLLDNSILKFTSKKTFLKNDITQIYIDKTKLEFNINKEYKNSFKAEGVYKIKKSDKNEKFKIENKFEEKKSIFNLDLNINQGFFLDLINYNKPKNTQANIISEFIIFKDKIDFKKLYYTDNQNKINIDNVILKNNKVETIEKISIKTYKEKIKNNDFTIFYGKKISIKGSQFDASNLPKILNQKKIRILYPK